MRKYYVKYFRLATGMALAGLAVGLLSLVPAVDVLAANGQCKWEGGPGADGGYPSCKQEDCIGNGGLAACTEAQAVAGGSYSNTQLGAERWAYLMCSETGWFPAHGGMWCAAAGGQWNGNYVGCLNTPPDILNLIGNATSDESRSKTITDGFVNSSCGEPTDTGWGASFSSQWCWGGSTEFEFGIKTRELRRLVYNVGEDCSSTKTMSLQRYRDAECPLGYQSRNAVVNGTECFKPQPVECDDPCSDSPNPDLAVGNPVSIVSGTKFEREEDYRVGADTGLELVRYYRSTGYYRPPGASFLPPSGSIASTDVWRHTYDRRIFDLSSVSTAVMAVLQRPNGSLRVFSATGTEITNHKGPAATLAAAGGGWDLTLGSGEVEHYNSSGRLATITSREGRVTTLSYADGLLTTVTGPFGHALVIAYNDDDLMETVTLPDAGVIRYEYDTLRRLSRVIYPDGTDREYRYESTVHEFLLTGIVDENDVLFATFQYDSLGRVINESHAGGVSAYAFSYDTVNDRTSVTDPLGTTSDFGYTAVDGMMYSSGRSQPCMDCGRWASTTYDANGNPASRTDFGGDQTVYSYDATRNLQLSRTEAYGTPRARTITTEWHATYPKPIKITETGRETTYTHDANGNVLTKTITDTASGESRTWSYGYNTLGQVTTIDGARSGVSDITTVTYSNCTTGGGCGQIATATDPAGNVTSVLTRNAHGLPLTISDANGTVTTLTYDARQRLTSTTTAGETTSIEYWPTGLIRKMTRPDGSFLSYNYDDAHRLVETSDAAGDRIQYTWDGAGNLLSQTIFDQAGTVTFSRTHSYDGLGRLIEETGSAAQTTSYTYENDGSIASQMDPMGRETGYAYDELGRLTTITNPLTQLTQFGYDALDNLVSVTDPKSQTTIYGLDGLGDVGQLTSPDTGVTGYTHDAAGNFETATDARNKTATYTYDAAGRLVQLAVPDRTIQYSYDQGSYGAGRLTGVSDSQSALAWTYDAAGRVVQRSQTVGTVTLDVVYGYDASGRLDSLTTPSGQTIGYSYGNGRVSGITVNGATLLSQIDYTPFGPASGWQWGNGTTTVRSYDTDLQLTSISSAGTTTFEYFLDGQIRSMTGALEATPTLAEGSTLNTIDPGSNRILGSNGLDVRSYSYDAAGNTLSDGSRTFAYNDSGRMATATSAGVTTTYVYSGLGERVKKSNTQVTRYFAYDEAGHLVGEYDGSGDLIQETVWFGDIPVATLRPNGSGGVDVYYVHTDHLNTPRRITRPADNVVVWEWLSTPFGTIDADRDPDGDQVEFEYRLRFPGQQFDEETGLYYNYYRTYDPATGRYLESDPIGLAGGANTYTYAFANPLSRIDPLGLDAWDIRGEWGSDEIQAYSDFMRNFVQNYSKKIDCADLGLLGLIRFASQNNLPVNLKYWANGKWNYYSAASDDFTSASQFETVAMRDLGALNVIDNSSPIGLNQLQPGDLLMTRYHSTMGHTRIVTESSCSDSCADADITWYQGSLPPVVPQRMRGPFSGINPGTLGMDQVPRRWNFKDWN